MKKHAKADRVMKWILFLLYLAVLTYLLFFAEILGRTQEPDYYRYNFIPFKEIRRYLNYYKILDWKIVFLNLAGNVLAFIPFGCLLPCVAGRRRFFVQTVLLTILFSAAVEGIQLVTRVGTCDVDDVILNTAGGILGYLLYLIASHVRRKKRKRSKG